MLAGANRLRRKKDFQKVYKGGKTLRTTFFRIKTVENHTKHSRYGIVIANKVIKKAVDRNRKKRQVRAVLGELIDTITKGYDIVVLAQSNIAEASHEEIQKDLKKSFQKIGFLPKQNQDEKKVDHNTTVAS